MKKGIIMEMDDIFLTLLTPEGEFLRARKSQHSYVIGEEIQFNPVLQKLTLFNLPKMERVKHKHVWAASAAAALLIFLGSLLPMYQDNKAYAYMYIDGSSSIQLGINKKIEVVELTGYNKEGKAVISHISNWKKKDATVIAEDILDEMKKEGLFTKNNQVIISTVSTGQKETNTEKKLTESLAAIKRAAEKDRLELNLVKGSEKDREKARNKGLTIGNYEESQKNPPLVTAPVEKPDKDQAAVSVQTPQNNGQHQVENVSPRNPDGPPGKVKKQNEAISYIPAPPQSIEETKAYNPPAWVKKMPPGLEKKKIKGHGKENFGQMKKSNYFNQDAEPNGVLKANHIPQKKENKGKGHQEH